MHLFKKVFPLLLLPLIWNLLWLIIGNDSLWPEFFATLDRLLDLSRDEKFGSAYLGSINLIIGSFAISITCSLLLASLSMRSRALKNFIEYMSAGIGPVPTMAWLPVFLILLGFNKFTIYAMCIWSVLWLATPQIIGLIDVARQGWSKQVFNLKFNTIKSLRHVYIPAVLPGFLAISKTYMMQIWRVIFAIEVIFGALGGHTGLGMLMFDYKGRFDHLETYASLLAIMLTGLLINWVFSLLQRYTKW